MSHGGVAGFTGFAFDGFASRVGLLRRDVTACARCLRDTRRDRRSPGSQQGTYAARRPDPACVWLAALDIAQLYAAMGFARELRARHPRVRFVMSVPAPRHGEMARAALDPTRDLVIPTPCDCLPSARRALRAAGAGVLVVFGNAVPLALARVARGCGVSTAWVGAEVSVIDLGLWQGDAAWQRALRRIDQVYLAIAGDADRLRALGVEDARTTITGSLKYDLALRASDESNPAGARAALRDAGIPDDAPVLLGGSLHPGEDDALLDAFVALRARHPTLALVLAPRVVADSPRATAAARAHGLRVAIYSATHASAPGGRANDADVLVVDITGELRALYAIATVAFVGRTLTLNTGSNVLEAAAHGVPVVVGPHMESFTEDDARFRDADALVRVRTAAELGDAIAALLADAPARLAYGTRARTTVERYAGGLPRTVTLFENALLSDVLAATDTREAFAE